jgi:hypothetical protein
VKWIDNAKTKSKQRSSHRSSSSTTTTPIKQQINNNDNDDNNDTNDNNSNNNNNNDDDNDNDFKSKRRPRGLSRTLSLTEIGQVFVPSSPNHGWFCKNCFKYYQFIFYFLSILEQQSNKSTSSTGKTKKNSYSTKLATYTFDNRYYNNCNIEK